MELDAAPGSEAPSSEHILSGAQAYLLGLVLSALLTALAFYFTGSDWLWGPSIPVALSVLAVAQIGVHLAFFLHLTTAPDSVNNSLALAFGTLIVALVIGGTLWIMYHMNLNMAPMTSMAPGAAGSPSATGIIEPASPTPVTARFDGIVRSVDCEVGVQVRQGQTCATIEARSLTQAVAQGERVLRAAQARVTQDRAALAAAQAKPDRHPAAKKRVGDLQQTLLRDERAVSAAQQELDGAKARLDDARIIAPADGIVVARNAAPGQAVAANAQPPLFLFAPADTVEFKASLPGTLATLKAGDTVVFTVDALRGRSFEGEVLAVLPSQAGHGGQLHVRAKNPDGTLKPGMRATVRPSDE
jgi:cytochrome o ubiquinol oxidase subunit IV